jgi:hypothetical protein
MPAHSLVACLYSASCLRKLLDAAPDAFHTGCSSALLAIDFLMTAVPEGIRHSCMHQFWFAESSGSSDLASCSLMCVDKCHHPWLHGTRSRRLALQRAQAAARRYSQQASEARSKADAAQARAATLVGAPQELAEVAQVCFVLLKAHALPFFPLDTFDLHLKQGVD